MLRSGALRIAVILALILVGAIAGATLSFAPAFLAIPIGLVVLAGILLSRWRAGRGEGAGERNRLGAEKLEFSERDRQTLYEGPPPERRRDDAQT